MPSNYKCTIQLNVFVGTVNAAGYLSMIHQMKELITRAGKKAYTLVMGKPNPAKLANFPEVNFATEKKKKREKENFCTSLVVILILDFHRLFLCFFAV